MSNFKNSEYNFDEDEEGSEDEEDNEQTIQQSKENKFQFESIGSDEDFGHFEENFSNLEENKKGLTNLDDFGNFQFQEAKQEIPTPNEIPFFQKSPQDIKDLIDIAFNDNKFDKKIELHEDYPSLLDILKKSNSYGESGTCLRCQCWGIFKYSNQICLVCGYDHKEKDKRIAIIQSTRVNFQKSLGINIVEDNKEEEDFFDSLRAIQPIIAMTSNSKNNQTPFLIKKQQLPTTMETSQPEDPQKKIHTDKYGFILDKISSEREKFELINAEREKERTPIWYEHIKLFGTVEFNTKQNPLKQIIRDGIPGEYRTKIWMYCSGAAARWSQYKGYYKELLINNRKNTSESIKIIDKDIQRTLATNLFFREPVTLKALRRILVAFSWHNTKIGYCQGMAYICGILLLLMKEEPAFWMFLTIVEKLLPEEYFTETLIAARVDQLVFAALISKKLPTLWKHFQTVNLNLNAVFYGWFICLFVNVLPIETVLRVWDVFFNEGNKILFRTGLALLKSNEKKLLECQDDNMIYALLKTVPSETYDGEELLLTAFNQIGSFPMRVIRSLRSKFRPQVLEEFVVTPTT